MKKYLITALLKKLEDFKNIVSKADYKDYLKSIINFSKNLKIKIREINLVMTMETDNWNDVEMSVTHLQNLSLEFLLVIDNHNDICYIHVADQDLIEIKKEIMPIISHIYKEQYDEELFISKFVDKRESTLFYKDIGLN